MRHDAPRRRRVHARWRTRHREPFVVGNAQHCGGTIEREPVPYSRVTGLDHELLAALRSMAAQARRRDSAN